MSRPEFDYSNHTSEPPGRLVRWGGRVLRGVREVQAQVDPYAAAWESHNRTAVAAGAGGPAGTARTDTAPLWVVLGDSMAQGIGSSAFDRGWPGRLAERVEALRTMRMVNLSVYGATVADVVRRQLPVLEDLTTHRPAALVTVVVGSNDLIGRSRRAALPAALDAMFARLPAGTVVASQPGGRAGTADFNSRLDTAADARGLLVADFRPRGAVDWRGKISRDLFHPNDAGYAAMADVIAVPVRRALAD